MPKQSDLETDFKNEMAELLVFSTRNYGQPLRINKAEYLHKQVCEYASENGCINFDLKSKYNFLPSCLFGGKEYLLPEKRGKIAVTHEKINYSHKHHVKIKASNEEIKVELGEILEEFWRNEILKEETND